MNRKQFILLIVVVAVVGGIGLRLNSKKEAGWKDKASDTTKAWLADLPVNDVTQIFIKKSDGEVTLVKTDDTWRVKERGDYPANFSSIRDFLGKAPEWKVVQSEPIGPSQLGRMQLLPPDKSTNSGMLVEFKDKNGKAIKSFIIGKPYIKKSESPSPFGGGEGFPDGRFILDQANPGTVVMIRQPLSQIEPKPADWLDKEFFRVEKVRAISVTGTTNAWALTRDTESADWKLTDPKPGEELDKNKNAGITGPLASLSFADVLAPDAKPEVTGLDKPTVIKVETFDNFVYAFNVGKATEENYYFTMTVSANPAKERAPGKDEKPEDKEKLDKEFADKSKQLAEKLQAEKKFEKWIFQVSKWSLEPILKDRSQLMADKKEEKKDDADKGEKKEPK